MPTLCEHSFFALVWKMHLLTMWPWPLIFQPQNHVTSRTSQSHSLHQVWTLWDYSFLSYAADKQTDRQTDRQTYRPEHSAHADSLRRYCITCRLTALMLGVKWVEIARHIGDLEPTDDVRDEIIIIVLVTAVSAMSGRRLRCFVRRQDRVTKRRVTSPTIPRPLRHTAVCTFG